MLEERRGHPASQWPEREYRQQRRGDVQRCGDPEHQPPAAGGVGQETGERHQQRRRALGGVEEAGVGGGVFRTEGVGAGCWKQAVDFAPGEKHEAGQQHKHARRMAEPAQRQNGEASSAKAMNMVGSRPMLSETQPKNGRVNPFSARSSESAKVRAGRVTPMRLTGTSATPKSLAIGPSWAVAIRPPAAIMTNIAHISQNAGVFAICSGEYWRRAAPAAMAAAASRRRPPAAPQRGPAKSTMTSAR